MAIEGSTFYPASERLSLPRYDKRPMANSFDSESGVSTCDQEGSIFDSTAETDQTSTSRFDRYSRVDSGMGSDMLSTFSDHTSVFSTEASCASQTNSDAAVDNSASGTWLVNLDDLAQWVVRCACDTKIPQHPTVKKIIEAFRQDEARYRTGDTESHGVMSADFGSNTVHGKYLKLIGQLSEVERSSIRQVFLQEKPLHAVRKIAYEIESAIDSRCALPGVRTPLCEETIVEIGNDALMRSFFPPPVAHEVHSGTSLPSLRDAKHLALRGSLAVFLTTFVREALKGGLNSNAATSIPQGARIALALMPTILAVALVAKDVREQGTKAGRWLSVPQTCRILLALSALTTPALLLTLGGSRAVAASLSTAIATFAYTGSRDVIQTYLPAGKSWKKNLLGIVGITTLYSGAQCGMDWLVSTFERSLKAAQAVRPEGQHKGNATLASIGCALSENQVSAVEQAVTSELAPFGWPAMQVMLMRSLFNFGIEYLDDLGRPPGYKLGEKGERRISHTLYGAPLRTSLALALPSIASGVPENIVTHDATHSRFSASDLPVSTAGPQSLLDRIWHNDGRRSCAFLGIVGLVGAADLYAAVHEVDAVGRHALNAVALFVSVQLMAGLFGGAQDDMEPEKPLIRTAEMQELANIERALDQDDPASFKPPPWRARTSFQV